MKLANKFKQLSALTLLTSLPHQVVLAHTGHDTGTLLHGILHTEHLLIVLAIAVAIAIGVAVKE